jgi:hypothetical protein
MPEGAHVHAATFICFPSFRGSVNNLVKKDPAEVGALSREMMLQSLSDPLQIGLRFFRIPLPALPSAFLAVGLPSPGRNTGLPCFA